MCVLLLTGNTQLESALLQRSNGSQDPFKVFQKGKQFLTDFMETGLWGKKQNFSFSHHFSRPIFHDLFQKETSHFKDWNGKLFFPD